MALSWLHLWAVVLVIATCFASFADKAEAAEKKLDIPNLWSRVMSLPFCMAPGVHQPQFNGKTQPVVPYRSEIGHTAESCFNACFDTYKTAKRGAKIYGGKDYSGWGYELAPISLGKLYNDEVSSGIFYPCYWITLFEDGHNSGWAANYNQVNAHEVKEDSDMHSWGFGDRTSYALVKEKSKTPFCNSDGDLPNGKGPMCTHWAFDGQANRCHLYSAMQKPVDKDNKEIVLKDIPGSFSGYTNCPSKLPTKYMEMAASPGCVTNTALWTGKYMKTENIKTILECRALCQRHNHCTIFHHDLRRGRCRMYSGMTPVVESIEYRHVYSGVPYCSTCAPGSYMRESSSRGCSECEKGYYCSGGLERTICPVGYYCDETNMIAPKVCTRSPEVQLCLEEGTIEPLNHCPMGTYGYNCEFKVKCLYAASGRGVCERQKDGGNCSGINGNGLCTECNSFAVGTICEHKVCKNSEVANHESLKTSYAHPVSDFDFSLYRAEQLSVNQVASDAGAYSLRVKFRPIAEEIETHRLFINGKPTPIESSAKQDCSASARYVFPDYDTKKSVGELIEVCVKGFWRENYRSLTAGTWAALSEGTNPRSNPVACISHKVQFETRIKIQVSDLFNSAKIPGVLVRVKIGDEEFEFIAEEGVIEETILLPDVAGGTRELPLEIQSATRHDGVEADFKLCASTPLLPNTRCASFTSLSFSDVVGHQSERQHQFHLVDLLALEVSGTVEFPFNSGRCGIENVSVVALDARPSAAGRIVAETRTDVNGQFHLPVPKQTRVRLELEYGDHVIKARSAGGASYKILQTEGILVDSKISELEFEDVTTRKITVYAAVSECRYDIGGFKLSLNACPSSGGDFKPSATYSRNLLEVEVPAHSYAYDLEFTNGIVDSDAAAIKAGFEYMFPKSSRTVDLTNGEQALEFIFQPEPAVTMQVAIGLFDPGKYSDTSCPNQEDPPFHFALQGNSPTKLRFEVIQTYQRTPGSSVARCYRMPDGMKLSVRSNMRVPQDPCSANGQGCLLDVKYGPVQGFNKSFAEATVFTGQPSESILWIKHQVKHPSFWPATTSLTLKEEKIILLGNKRISGDTVVTFFGEGQDHVPLLYVYAPPGPHEDSSQSVRVDFEVTTETQKYKNTLLELGGGGSVGIATNFEGNTCVPFNGCPFKNAQVEFSSSVGFNALQGKTIGFYDKVHSVAESNGMELSTAPGRTPEDGDIVLLLGTAAKFIKSRYVYFNYSDPSDCRVQTKDSIAWGSKVKSLLLHSRPIIREEIEMLEDTIRVKEKFLLEEEGLTDERREEVEKLLLIAKNSRKHWYALLDHWEADKQQAKNYPVDLQAMALRKVPAGDVSFNRIVYGATRITLERSVIMSSSSLMDYQSTTSVMSGSKVTEFSALFGAGLIKGPTGSFTAEVATVTEQIFSKTRDESKTLTVTATLVEEDEKDVTCLEVYESPHSKTFVFEVCGGQTKCPRVEGTDARESLILTVENRPNSLLQDDKSRFDISLDISDSREDTVDVIIELEAQTAVYPVAYNIGSQSLNQPQRFSLSEKVTKASIYFERLDPSLQQITVGGSVRSACDDSIISKFGFEVRWESSCPSAAWGGSLKNPGDHFRITQAEPDLAVVAVNPLGTKWSAGYNVDVTVSLWARRFMPETSPWFKVDNKFLRTKIESSESSSFTEKQDKNGFSTLYLSAENALFINGERYLLELRSECTKKTEQGAEVKLGETRSGARLGVVDMDGPKLISHTSTVRVKKAVAGFPVAKLLFDEPIDCAHRDLRANVFQHKQPSIKGKAGVYCSGNMNQLHVVLRVKSLDEIRTWSSASIGVEISGIRDIYGNWFGQNGRYSSGPRGLNTLQNITMRFTAPKIPMDSGFDNTPWIMPNRTKTEALLKAELERKLPSGYAYSSMNSADDFIVQAPPPNKVVDQDVATIAGAAGGGVAGLLAIAALVLLRKGRLSSLGFSRTKPERSQGEGEHIQVAKTI